MTTFALPVPSEAPRLRPAHLSDYAAIAHVEAQNGLATPPEPAWRRLWLDNPLWPRVGGDWPIGWVLEQQGVVVGSIVSVPSLYHLRGRELISANGRGWNVLPTYRAFALWLMEEYFNQAADLFINTTVGPMATSALDELARRVPVGNWTDVSYWVTDYPTLTRRVLERHHVPFASAVARPAAGLIHAGIVATHAERWPMPESLVDVEVADRFDERFDTFWPELLRHRPETLLGRRDRQTLAWHFDAAERQGRLWVLTAWRAGALRAYAVCTVDTVALGVRRAQLIDYQSIEDQGDPLPALIRAARARAARDGVSVVEHLGTGLPRYAAFDQCAPHRRVKPCWPHYYRTNHPDLAAELGDTEVWDPSLFDGDASLD